MLLLVLLLLMLLPLLLLMLCVVCGLALTPDMSSPPLPWPLSPCHHQLGIVTIVTNVEGSWTVAAAVAEAFSHGTLLQLLYLDAFSKSTGHHQDSLERAKDRAERLRHHHRLLQLQLEFEQDEEDLFHLPESELARAAVVTARDAGEQLSDAEDELYNTSSGDLATVYIAFESCAGSIGISGQQSPSRLYPAVLQLD